ncbi:MAG: hypothetical protein GY737_14540 [Desulfobacteraceae bacterium]|nr:hypothetical protein [Desulfobacteraceae bacterium]
MKLKYQKNAASRLTTPCPHKPAGDHIMVGSLKCQSCEHHQGQDQDKQIVECGKEE